LTKLATSSKLWAALLGLIMLITKWAVTGAPPDPIELAAAITALITYIGVEGWIDGKAAHAAGLVERATVESAGIESGNLKEAAKYEAVLKSVIEALNRPAPASEPVGGHVGLGGFKRPLGDE